MTPSHTSSVAACATCLGTLGVDPLLSGVLSGAAVFILHHVGVFAARKLNEWRDRRAGVRP